jgi:heme-degrading monooxygenase HmoA
MRRPSSPGRWLLAVALALVLALVLFPAASGRSAAPAAERGWSPAVARVWHGRTPNAKADEYARYLTAGAVKFRTIPGNLGYQVVRETIGPETHFMVVSYWASRDAIHGYAGEDIRKTRHLPRDAEFLIDPEQTVMNYEVMVNDLGPTP